MTNKNHPEHCIPELRKGEQTQAGDQPGKRVWIRMCRLSFVSKYPDQKNNGYSEVYYGCPSDHLCSIGGRPLSCGILGPMDSPGFQGSPRSQQRHIPSERFLNLQKKKDRASKECTCMNHEGKATLLKGLEENTNRLCQICEPCL